MLVEKTKDEVYRDRKGNYWIRHHMSVAGKDIFHDELLMASNTPFRMDDYMPRGNE